MYKNRSKWSQDIDDAKIFNTANAAKNSANNCPDKQPFEVLPVEIRVIEQETPNE